MPKRDTSAVGAPCWIELSTSDQPGAMAFYGQLFGWQSTEPNEEFGGYANFTKDGELVAGCMRRMPEMQGPDVWGVYLSTTDAEALTKEVEAHGGGVIAGPMAVGDLGTMAVFTDPGGAVIGAWQPGTHLGIGVLDEPGQPTWFELHTRAYDTVVPFYRDVFGWSTQVEGDAPDFRYTTAVGAGGAQYAGVMDASAFLPSEVPSHWAAYIAVDDVDATLARATELGGSVVEPAVDTPYGRLATLADPTGARIKLRGEAAG
jgi:predicted enzyme related to lactoylglutathione lyase